MAIDRRTAIVVALVGILILTAAAASIADPDAAGDGWGSGQTDWIEDPDVQDPDIDDPDAGEPAEDYLGIMPSRGALCIPILFEIEVQLFLLSALILGTGLMLWRTNLFATAVAFIGIVPMASILYLALHGACQGEEQEPQMITDEAVEVLEQFNQTTGGTVDTVSDPFIILVILAVIGLLAIGLVILRNDVASTVDQSTEQIDESTDTHELGRIAGATARRLEDDAFDDAGLENEIYRAWLEMTTHLELSDHDTSTPGEFATEAIELGMDPADVEELTALFEDVRYGDRPVSTDREEQAIEVLRRIEHHFSDES